MGPIPGGIVPDCAPAREAAARCGSSAVVCESDSHLPYLAEYSAGSGKSKTISWLVHRLSTLHDADDTKVFDQVIVVTDRMVLDRQLRDEVAQFESTKGVVEKIEEGSRQLAEALAKGTSPIVVTTLQKARSRRRSTSSSRRPPSSRAAAMRWSSTSTQLADRRGGGLVEGRTWRRQGCRRRERRGRGRRGRRRGRAGHPRAVAEPLLLR